MGRPRLHDDLTAEALLDAGETLVAAGGPDALSVRAVADLAGTTTRAVYSVFGSKEGLLVALGSRAFSSLGRRVAAMPRTRDPAADLVSAGVGCFRPWALEHPALFRLAFQRSEVTPELAERFRPARMQAYAGLVELVSRAYGLLGGSNDPNVRNGAIMFHAMCEGLTLLELRGVIPPDRGERLWREALVALVSGMQTQSSPGHAGPA